MIAGSLLSYLDVELDIAAGGSAFTRLNGVETDDGKFFLAFGIAFVLASTVLWMMKSGGARVLLAGIAVIVSGFMVYVGIASITGLPDDAIQGLADRSAPGSDRDRVVAELEEVVSADAGTGLYVSTAGALLALGGALLALRSRPRPESPAQLPLGWAPPDGSMGESVREPVGSATSPWGNPERDY